MKKILSLLVILLIPFMAMSSKYQEGKQYTTVNEQASEKPEVREYFSFYCPHCFRFEPLFANIRAELPTDLPFHRNHVDFLHAASKDIQFMLTKGLVVAQQMNMEKKMTAAIFNYIHVQHATFSNEKDLRNVFVLQGADGEQFDKLMKSFTVNAIAKKMQKNQNYFSDKKALTGVPTVIVNNKYRINPQELDKTDPAADYKNLIVYLSKMK